MFSNYSRFSISGMCISSWMKVKLMMLCVFKFSMFSSGNI